MPPSSRVTYLLLISVPVILIVIFLNFQQQQQQQPLIVSSFSLSDATENFNSGGIEEEKQKQNKHSTSVSSSQNIVSPTNTMNATANEGDAIYFKTREEYEVQRRKDLARFDEVIHWNNHTPELDQELLHLINPPPSLNSEKHSTTTKRYFYKNLPIHPCPLYRHKIGKDADSKTNNDAVKKYTRYTHQFCNTSGMLQMFFNLRRYLFFLDVMAKIVNLKEGDKVFDLGSGCGTMLNYYHLKFGTTGLGIDITGDAVAHAKSHARENQTFCHLDATLLRAFPSNSFDVVMSWAVLYHLRRTWVQCAVMKELTRMLKPGGVALMAQIRTEKTQAFWKKGKCQIEGASWRRLSDTSIFREKSFKRNGFFSIYLTKDGESAKKNTSAMSSFEVSKVTTEEDAD